MTTHSRQTIRKPAKAFRSLALLLALCLLPLLPLGGTAQEEVTNLFGTTLLDQPQIYTVYDSVRAVARAGDTLYIRTTSHLYTFSPGDTAAQKRVLLPNYNHRADSLEGADQEGAPYIKTIVSDGETLYGLDLNAQTLYKIAIEGDKLVSSNPVSIDLSDYFEGEGRSLQVRDPQWSLISGGRLYLRFPNYEEKPSDLISFDIKSGERKQHQVAHIQTASPYKDGKLIGLQFDINNAWDPQTQEMKKPAIVVFDPADDSLEEVGSFAENFENSDELLSAYYDPQEDALYTYTDTDLYRYDAPFKESRLVGYLPMYSLFTNSIKGGVTPMPDGRLAIAFSHNIFLRERTEKGLEGYVPLVMGGELDMMDGRTIMRILNKMDKVVLRRTGADVGYVGPERLAAMFLTGQVAVDIMPINASAFDLDKLIEKGYLADLSSNQHIRDYVSAFTPNLRDTYVKEGKIYAAPANMMVNPVAYAEEAFQKTGLPIPTSFAELIDLTERWVGGLHEEHPDFRLFGESNYQEYLRRLFINTYIDARLGAREDLVFDTPEFRETLSRIDSIDFGDFGLKANYDDPGYRAMMEEMRDKKQLIISNEGYEPQYMTGINNQGERRRLPLNLPVKEGGEYYKNADFTMLTVLSTSKYPEEAARFIQYFLEGLDPIFTMAFNMDLSEDVPNPDYDTAIKYQGKKIADLEEELKKAEGAERSNLEENLKWHRENYENSKEHLKFLATKEDMDLIHAYIKTLYLMDGLGSAQGLAYLHDSQTQQQYFNGAITLDQFIKVMDDKMRLVRTEYQ